MFIVHYETKLKKQDNEQFLLNECWKESSARLYFPELNRLYQAAQVVQAAERKIEIPNMAWTNTQFRIFEEHLFDVLSGQLKLQTLLDLL